MTQNPSNADPLQNRSDRFRKCRRSAFLLFLISLTTAGIGALMESSHAGWINRHPILLLPLGSFLLLFGLSLFRNSRIWAEFNYHRTAKWGVRPVELHLQWVLVWAATAVLVGFAMVTGGLIAK